MQCSVCVVVEVDEAAEIGQMEAVVQEAGRQAMRAALPQVVRQYEEAHARCPSCGRRNSRSHGTVRRCVLTRFGRVVLSLRRQRCLECGTRFRPAAGCLASLGRDNVTSELATDCALAGASWPYASAARTLQRLSGAQVSHETLRQCCLQAGQQEAAAQQAEAEALLSPTAEQVRAERDAQDAQDRAQRLGQPQDTLQAERPKRLTVGFDGGWVPSRDQLGGMEGKVGVVATGTEAVGQHGRQRLTPRRLVATFGSSEQVGALAYAAAATLGGTEAGEHIVLGDGAEWIKTQTAWHFPDAVGILDWAHANRALHKAIRAARPGRAQKKKEVRRQLHQQIPALLWQGDVEATLAALRALRPVGSSTAPADPIPRLEETIRYLEGQRAWLGNYAAWQEQGYPVGSGLIERAVAIVINWRMKKRGMRWKRANASALVALRVREINAGWDPEETVSPLVA